jgi:hypothetical protein
MSVVTKNPLTPRPDQIEAHDAVIDALAAGMGSPPSFRLSYRTDAEFVSEFLPLQHPSSGARWHAGNKWKQLSRARQTAPPLSAQEADARFRSGELRRPARVLVERDGQWLRIKATDFTLEPAA